MPIDVTRGTNPWAENAGEPRVAEALGRLFLKRQDRGLRIEPGYDPINREPRWQVSMAEQHVVHGDLATALEMLERKLP